jgi:hypothetical protein
LQHEIRLVASFAGSGALSATLLQDMRVAASFAGAGRLVGEVNIPSQNVYRARLGAVGEFALGQWSVKPVQSVAHLVTATFAGAGNLTGDVRVNKRILATFAGAGALSGSLSVGMRVNATFAGSGLLTALIDAGNDRTITALFAGSGSLTATLRQGMVVGANFGGAGSLTATLTAINKAITANFAGVGALTASLDVARPGVVYRSRLGAVGELALGQWSVKPVQYLPTNHLITANFVGLGTLVSDIIVQTPGFPTNWLVTAQFAGAGALTAALSVVHPGIIYRSRLGAVGELALGQWSVIPKPVPVSTNWVVSASFAGRGGMTVELDVIPPAGSGQEQFFLVM